MPAKEFVPLLEAFIKEQTAISGHWNGSDDRYIGHDGGVYTEDDAHIAQERADAAEALLKVINEYDV